MIASPSPLNITFRHGIWHVTLNGMFFGDYRSQSDADDAVREALEAFRIAAGLARSEQR